RARRRRARTEGKHYTLPVGQRSRRCICHLRGTRAATSAHRGNYRERALLRAVFHGHSKGARHGGVTSVHRACDKRVPNVKAAAGGRKACGSSPNHERGAVRYSRTLAEGSLLAGYVNIVRAENANGGAARTRSS